MITSHKPGNEQIMRELEIFHLERKLQVVERKHLNMQTRRYRFFLTSVTPLNRL